MSNSFVVNFCWKRKSRAQTLVNARPRDATVFTRNAGDESSNYIIARVVSFRKSSMVIVHVSGFSGYFDELTGLIQLGEVCLVFRELHKSSSINLSIDVYFRYKFFLL